MHVLMHHMIRMFLMFLVSCYHRERDSLPWCGEDSSLSLGFWRFSIDLGVVPLRQLTNKNNEQRVKNIELLKTKIQIPSTEIDKTEKKVNLRGSSHENKLVAIIQMKVFWAVIFMWYWLEVWKPVDNTLTSDYSTECMKTIKQWLYEALLIELCKMALGSHLIRCWLFSILRFF